MIIANMISARDFAKQNLAKNTIRYHNAEGHTKCDKFIITIGTTEMGFDFYQVDLWFNPYVIPLHSFVFNKTFLSSNCV